MAKRSRMDFESSSPESEASTEHTAPSRVLAHPGSANPPASSSKIQHTDLESGEAEKTIDMRCSLPGHRPNLIFTSYEEYDIHYAQMHTNRCLLCKKNFPTEHFLNIHIEENHDALVSVRRERGEKTYACFLEDCERKCSTPQKRKMHLIDKHMFPKEYDFYVVKEGTDRKSSMLRSGRHRRKSSAAKHMAEKEERTRRRTSTMEAVGAVDAEESWDPSADGVAGQACSLEMPAVLTPPRSKDDEMEGLLKGMSALKFVPTSVRFGRGGRGKGFSKT